MIYFLDTDICIYAFRGLFDLEEKIALMMPESIKLPAIVHAELLFGALRSADPKRTGNIVEAFAACFEIVPFDATAAADYAELRLGLEKAGAVIGPNDLLIASIVRSRGGTLVTHNTREFARVPGLKVRDWTEAP